MNCTIFPRLCVLCSRSRRYKFSNIFCIRRKSSNVGAQTKLKTEKWQAVVGLEVHAQISSCSKLFSGAGTDFGSPVNSNVSFFDAAIPGTLPVLNQRCVEAAVLTALALSCKVNAVSSFDRKHYFYADLPAGYQITQQRSPLAENGELQFPVFLPGRKKSYIKSSSIKQLQLEQDSGKSLHDDVEQRSLIDLNRAGIPLMELVFEPDLQDGEEAAALIKELSLILTRLQTCSCKMEEGALRVDANVSVHQQGQPFGIRTETKNISSIRGVANAIDYEIQRQIRTLNEGGIIFNETRAWDSVLKQTLPMRDKEEKQDYRYMPEPNLPPLRLLVEGHPVPKSAKNLIDVKKIKNQMPELPEETRQKLMNNYGLSVENSIVLVNENTLLQHFFCITEEKKRNPIITANLLLMHFLGIINKNKISVEECSVTSIVLGEIIDLIEEGKINFLIVKKLLNEIVAGNTKSPLQIVQEKRWTQITDEKEIRNICVDVLKNNQKMVRQYQAGKTKVFDALLGLVAKSTEHRANMEKVVQEMKHLLSKS